MPNIFLTSDTHFGHSGVTKFLRKDGITKLRPFDTVEEMDEVLVQNWNKVVRPQDKVYHLGDVLINRRAFTTLSRLNGDKVLVRGNHDIYKDHEYYKYFRSLRGYVVFQGMNWICSHIPIHTSQFTRYKLNIHGHLHDKLARLDDGNVDPRYFNVSVEQTNYTPISLEEIKQNERFRNIP